MRRIGEFVLGGAVLLYGADFIGLRLRAQPTGTVEVHQFYAVRLKGKKVEYMPIDNANETCAHSLLPQMGYLPCWYVERHRIRMIEVGN